MSTTFSLVLYHKGRLGCLGGKVGGRVRNIGWYIKRINDVESAGAGSAGLFQVNGR